MNEADWLTSADPQAMLTLLRNGGKLSDRTALLSHLRSAGPHVRGCHAVDLLTGRG